MESAEEILISVRHEHALNMMNGTKTVELRRRRLHITPGTRIWVYSKLPRGHVDLVATADAIVIGPPTALWKQYHRKVGITLSEFRTYFHGVEMGCAIALREIIPLRSTLTLNSIRQVSQNFRPPQFFKRLVAQSELQNILTGASLSTAILASQYPNASVHRTSR
jgi:predicted transcriptional regulator